MDKPELRKLIIKKRDTLSSEEILQNSRYIFEKLVCLPEYEKAKQEKPPSPKRSKGHSHKPKKIVPMDWGTPSESSDWM